MAAHKDRLIQAADLLGMTPDDLMGKLDPPAVAAGTGRADDMLARIRALAVAIRTDRDIDASVAWSLADAVAELDAHLSAGGTPPEAWREGPDAPYMDADR